MTQKNGSPNKKRRIYGEHSVSWSNAKQRFVAEAIIGYDERGRRKKLRRQGTSETAALRALRDALKQLEKGVNPSSRYTVAQAVTEWLEMEAKERDSNTWERNEMLCNKHVIPKVGHHKLNKLTALEVERWLRGLTTDLSTSTLRLVRSCLQRSVRRAMAHGHVGRNVVDLVDTPTGKQGRPSKALAMAQVVDVLNSTKLHRLHPYIVLSMVTGARTEEVRALRWENVHLQPANGAQSEVFVPYIEVWRSVRKSGDTKTRKSRRTLALPDIAVDALQRRKADQVSERAEAGGAWGETGLVFTTVLGGPMDANNTIRDFRSALTKATSVNPKEWTPREMRHSFVSMLSDSGVPLEEISRLCGHSSTAVTETVYRHQIRPVVQTGARAIDAILESNSTHVIQRPES